MIRTIKVGSCISIQGTYEREADSGRIVIRVGGATYVGKPVTP